MTAKWTPVAEQVHALIADWDEARAALARIEALHTPSDTFLYATASCLRDHETANNTDYGEDVCLTCTASDGGPRTVCLECHDEDGESIDWPCPTIVASRG